jgi:hypothetical protein
MCAHIAAVNSYAYKVLKPRSMPEAELGTFGVVAGEELEIEIKISRRGVLFASLACCGAGLYDSHLHPGG